MLKLIYLAKRKPGFTVDDFVRRWRMHGARGIEQPLWRHALGYVQAEPIRPAPITGCSEELDAIACFMLDDAAFAQMSEEDLAGAAIMLEDERETFAAPITSTSLWVDEHRLEGAELGGNTAFLFFTEEEPARGVAERTRSATGLHRVTLNLKRDDGPLGPDANTLPYAAVVELSAVRIADLAAAVESDGDPLQSRAELTVVTREAVLWDRMPPRP